MRIILVGATGTLGSAVDKALNTRHEIVRVGRKRGDFQVAIADPAAIEQLFSKVGEFDAVVSSTGDVHFGPFIEFDQDKFHVGLRSKLMGQVNLVAFGLKHIRDGGSFTLTTGQINEDPIGVGASGAMINGGLEAFARSVANRTPGGLRINVISPTVTQESWSACEPFFPGQKPVPASEAALGYVKSVEGRQTGKVTESAGLSAEFSRSEN
jgi:Enoyl-(Acyl carrier protein) reductase